MTNIIYSQFNNSTYDPSFVAGEQPDRIVRAALSAMGSIGIGFIALQSAVAFGATLLTAGIVLLSVTAACFTVAMIFYVFGDKIGCW